MRRLLGGLEAAATRRPRAVVAVLIVVTVGMAALATRLEVEVDLTQFGSDDSVAVQAMQRVRTDFGDPTAVVQVIFDAGPDGDLLTAAGMQTLAAAELVTTDVLGPDLLGDDGSAALLSLAGPVGSALAQQGRQPGQATDEEVGALAAGAIVANPHLASLVSDDLDLDAGRARATVLVAQLDPALTESQRTDAGDRLKAAFDDDPAGVPSDVRVTVFSSGLFASGLLDAIRAETPRLFGLALLVVLAILALAYRSLFDVAVGFAGLVMTVVCTFGFASLLGPAHLGWTGPLSQLAVIVPVLLVGLGIDYSVHLTARYREQRATGQSPVDAAGGALQTVGAALVLATSATAIGFASIATAPVQMLADFGVYVAVGVVVAMAVMSLLVPAARVLRDRRAPATAPSATRQLGLGGLMRGPVWLAQRRPRIGLAVGATLVAASLLAATGLEVEFDRDDFIPEGSDIEAVLAHQQELFGGGVTESTFVVVDGDLTDPVVADAVWQAQQRAGGIEGVRSVGGQPQVVSALSMVAALESAGPPADADLDAAFRRLRDLFGEHRVDQVLAPDAQAGVVQIRTTAGDAGAERVAHDVEAAFRPVEAVGASVTVTSEPIIIAEMSDDLSAFQARSIGVTLAIVLVLLTAYYALTRRRWALGPIAMVPAVVSAALVLGTMWALGITFNILTATLTAIAVGIGVPYGVHVVNRFAEDLGDAPATRGRRRAERVPRAAARTLHGTGAALAGSALTTLGAFVVLSFSGLPPIRSLGLLGGAGIAFALLAALLVEPGALVWWAARHEDGAPGTTGASPQGH